MRSENQVFASIQTAPIDVPSLLSSFGTDADGAISAFIGKIRNHDPETEDARVVAIQYSAHPEAETILERIVSEATMGAPDAANIHVLVIHRIGLVKVGEVALLTLVAAPHRRPGISLVGEIVERVKAELPVWKKQVLDDGSEKWSRLP